MNKKHVPAPSHHAEKPEPARTREEDQDLARLIALMERMGAAADPAT
jgi:hypothetical protein